MASPTVSLDQLATAGFAFDAGDRIVSWNPAAADLYGLSPTEAVGQSVLLLVPHEATADFHKAVEVVHQAGRWHGELRTMAIDHTPRVVETAWSSLETADGGRVVVALHTDVTLRQIWQREERRPVALKGIRSVARELAATPGVPAALAGSLRLVTDWEDLSLFLGGGRGVLVAGSNRLTRELVNQLLVGHDYVVFAADTVFGAVELLRRFRDDIRVAVLDFPEAVGELRRVRPQLPTVILTPAMAGRDLLESVAMAIAEGELNPV